MQDEEEYICLDKRIISTGIGSDETETEQYVESITAMMQDEEG